MSEDIIQENVRIEVIQKLATALEEANRRILELENEVVRLEEIIEELSYA